MPEGDRDVAPSVGVPDADQRPAGHLDAELLELAQPARHEALAAGLVDRGRASLDHDDRQPRTRGPQRRGQADRPAADDHEVGRGGAHAAAPASARSSTRIRVRSSTAFSTVKAVAVIQAVCTSGSATPSTTTAT